MVRAKFTVQSYETSLQKGIKSEPREDGRQRNWSNPEDTETVECRTVKMSAVADGSEENKKFFRFTPSGQINIGILNQAAWEQLPLGAEVYVDFTLAK